MPSTSRSSKSSRPSSSTPNSSIQLAPTTPDRHSLRSPENSFPGENNHPRNATLNSEGATTITKPENLGSEIVVVQSEIDGFYYEGLKSPQKIKVKRGFQPKHKVYIPATDETVITKNVLYVNGAIARPQLNINDLVLCKHQITINDRPDLIAGRVSLNSENTMSYSNKMYFYLPALVLDVNKKFITCFIMEKEIKIVNRTSCIRVGRQNYVDAVIKIQNFYSYGPGRKICCKFTPAAPKKSKKKVAASRFKQTKKQLNEQKELIMQTQVLTNEILNEQSNFREDINLRQDEHDEKYENLENLLNLKIEEIESMKHKESDMLKKYENLYDELSRLKYANDQQTKILQAELKNTNALISDQVGSIASQTQDQMKQKDEKLTYLSNKQSETRQALEEEICNLRKSIDYNKEDKNKINLHLKKLEALIENLNQKQEQNEQKQIEIVDEKLKDIQIKVASFEAIKDAEINKRASPESSEKSESSESSSKSSQHNSKSNHSTRLSQQELDRSRSLVESSPHWRFFICKFKFCK